MDARRLSFIAALSVKMSTPREDLVSSYGFMKGEASPKVVTL